METSIVMIAFILTMMMYLNYLLVDWIKKLQQRLSNLERKSQEDFYEIGNPEQ